MIYASKNHFLLEVSVSTNLQGTNHQTIMWHQATPLLIMTSTLTMCWEHSRTHCTLEVLLVLFTLPSLTTKRPSPARNGRIWARRTLTKTICSARTSSVRFKSWPRRFPEFPQRRPKSLLIFPSLSSLRREWAKVECQTGSEVTRSMHSTVRTACQTLLIRWLTKFRKVTKTKTKVWDMDSWLDTMSRVCWWTLTERVSLQCKRKLKKPPSDSRQSV